MIPIQEIDGRGCQLTCGFQRPLRPLLQFRCGLHPMGASLWRRNRPGLCSSGLGAKDVCCRLLEFGASELAVRKPIVACHFWLKKTNCGPTSSGDLNMSGGGDQNLIEKCGSPVGKVTGQAPPVRISAQAMPASLAHPCGISALLV